MRVGLVGTGPWAHLTTGPGIAAAGRADLAGIWGRDPDRTRRAAAALHTRGYPSYAELLSDVDAVVFSVAPAAQPALAVQAAAAGKHLLLDKPVALTVEEAHAVRDAVAAAGVTALVFFTDRYSTSGRAWFADLAATGGWRGGMVRWLTALDTPGNPFAGSAWRRDRGAFTDLTPHVISTMTAAVGPVLSVSGTRGAGDVVHLVLGHESGRSSTATLTVLAPPAAAGVEFLVWGDAGISILPARESEALACASAVDELAELAGSGRTDHPCDLRLGVHVVELMAAAAIS